MTGPHLHLGPLRWVQRNGPPEDRINVICPVCWQEEVESDRRMRDDWGWSPIRQHEGLWMVREHGLWQGRCDRCGTSYWSDAPDVLPEPPPDWHRLTVVYGQEPLVEEVVEECPFCTPRRREIRRRFAAEGGSITIPPAYIRLRHARLEWLGATVWVGTCESCGTTCWSDSDPAQPTVFARPDPKAERKRRLRQCARHGHDLAGPFEDGELDAFMSRTRRRQQRDAERLFGPLHGYRCRRCGTLLHVPADRQDPQEML